VILTEVHGARIDELSAWLENGLQEIPGT
jgi:hypothetical protein